MGHTGTLDPFASGLLVMLVGRCTRLAQFLVGQPKTYTGVIVLGQKTDTGDHTGTVLAESDSWRALTDIQIETEMRSFLGETRQTPPTYSAKKIDGVAAHRRVRRGEDVVLREQLVQIASFELTGREGQFVHFRADVGSGTYVRSLASDLGHKLGCEGHLNALRRESVGVLRVEDACQLDEVGPSFLLSATKVLGHLPTIEIDAQGRDEIRHGRAVPMAVEVDGPVAVRFGEDLVAVGQVDSGLVRPRVVLVT